jgi:hypothetical protein
MTVTACAVTTKAKAVPESSVESDQYRYGERIPDGGLDGAGPHHDEEHTRCRMGPEPPADGTRVLVALPAVTNGCHCEERSDDAISTPSTTGLLRCARNDWMRERLFAVSGAICKRNCIKEPLSRR